MAFARLIALFLSLVCPLAAHGWTAITITVDFESTGVPLNTTNNFAFQGPFPDNQIVSPTSTRGTLTTQGLTINNEFVPANAPFIDFFNAFAISQRTNVSSAPLFADGNPTVSASGDGADQSDTWVVAYDSNGFGPAPVLDVGTLSTIDSLMINNTAFASFDINETFGLRSRDEFFSVRFTDLDEGDFEEVPLATYTAASQVTSIVSDWTHVDLESLDASRIGISLAGSVSNEFGLLTPTYVAIDSVVVTTVPEPASGFAIIAIGSLLVNGVRRRVWNQ